MLTQDKINFAARFEYLKALEQHRPEVLNYLHRPTFVVYRTYLQANPKSTAIQTLARLSTALSQGVSPELSKVDQALRQWVNAHNLQDRWIWDAAIQTMDGWVRAGIDGKWGYFPEELDTPKFQPSFGYWIPAYTRWTEFKQVTGAIYRRELASYRAKVSQMWGERQVMLSEHAVWTVQWQQGRSPHAIKNRYFKTTGKTVSLANIQQAVHAFARAASLTLRKPKAGRGAKKM
jgi:hypothetical protein